MTATMKYILRCNSILSTYPGQSVNHSDTERFLLCCFLWTLHRIIDFDDENYGQDIGDSIIGQDDENNNKLEKHRSKEESVIVLIDFLAAIDHSYKRILLEWGPNNHMCTKNAHNVQ